MGSGRQIREYILWYTQFYDTYIIDARELKEVVIKKFHAKYKKTNRFREIYPDKMPQFRKYKGNDGYEVYERIDITPDPDWTLNRYIEYEETYQYNKWFEENEDFIVPYEFARKNDLKDFEIYLLKQKLLEE